MGKKPRKNWSKQYDIETKIVFVRKEEDIIRRVKLAIRRGTRVRAMGSLFNFVDIVQPMPSNRLTYPDILLNMDKYNKVLEVDTDKMTVKVEAGIKLIDLGKHLEKFNVLLSNYGNVDGQSIGGLIATGTHGRSVYQGSFSSFIKSVTIIDGRGEKVYVDFDAEEDQELANAVGLSVGLLGIFSVIELRTVPLYYLRSINFPQTVDWVCENWNTIQEDSDYVELSYFPILDTVIVGRSMRMIQEKPNAPILEIGGPYKRRPDRDIFPPRIIFGILAIFYIFSFLLVFPPFRYLYRYIFRKAINADHVKEYISIASDCIVQNNSLPIRHVEMDLCFDYDDFPQVMKAIQNYYKKNKKRMVNPVVDIRCAKAEPFYLSGAYGKRVFWVDFISLRYGARYNRKYHKQLNDLLAPFKFKRHWGKMSYLSRADIEERYGEELVKFVEIRKQMDPDGIFKNHYMDDLIGDASAPAGKRTIIRKGQVASYNDDSDEEFSNDLESDDAEYEEEDNCDDENEEESQDSEQLQGDQIV